MKALANLGISVNILAIVIAEKFMACDGPEDGQDQYRQENNADPALSILCEMNAQFDCYRSRDQFWREAGPLAGFSL